MTDKKTLRAAIRQRFKTSTQEERERWSKEICNNLSNHEALTKARILMAFYPMADEVDILPLLASLHSKGVQIVVPEVVNDKEMVLRNYSPDATMLSGALGTQVPETEIFNELDKIDAVLVPGMAFDRDGRRLGRGKGFYDRFLAMLPTSAKKIAVCYPFQIVEQVPTEEHDILMDYV